MPSFSSQLQLSSTAKTSNIVLADIDRVKGAFKVYATANAMNTTSINYFTDKQIVYVQDSASLYQATITAADYINTFEAEVLKESFVFDYFKNEKTNEYKIGYRFIFQSHNSTIKEIEVEKIMNTIIAESTAIKTVTIPGIA